jgi:hypothetical protein
MLYSCIFTAFLVFFSLANALHNVTYNDNDPAVVYNPAADWLVLSSLNAYVLTYYIGLTGLRLAVYHGNGRSGSLNAPILNFFFGFTGQEDNTPTTQRVLLLSNSTGMFLHA